MNNIEFFRLILQDEFNLKNYVWIKPKRNIRWAKSIKCFGMYEGEHIRGDKYSHIIEFDKTMCDYDIFRTLAHEFIHAWQMENNLELEHEEQKEYKEWADYFLEYYDFLIV